MSVETTPSRPSASPARLALIAPANMPMVRAGDDLAALALAALAAEGEALADGDVVVFAQKVVSKAEGRMRRLEEVAVSSEAAALAAEVDKDARLVQAILDESVAVVRKARGVLVVRHRRGFVMANAGVDQSNLDPKADAEGRVLLLPADPDASAAALRAAFAAQAGARVAVVINDSFGRPFRNGTTGVALGAAGLPALDDRRGRRDLTGRELRVTEIALADEIAAAASLLMGGGAEGRPFAVLRGLAWDGPDRPAADLVRDPARDLFL